MTNYNDGQIHGWNGGDCPVHPETVVEYRLREAVREGNLEGIQAAFDACEEWIDFAFGQNKGESHE